MKIFFYILYVDINYHIILESRFYVKNSMIVLYLNHIDILVLSANVLRPVIVIILL